MISIHELTKKFGTFCAVDSISLEVPSGKIFAFLGPNGAGKTTTIKMLTTTLRPTSGSISVAGFDPVRQPMDVRKAFGIVFQDPSLDSELTAYENMEIHSVLYKVPKKERKERIESFMRFVELWDRKDSFARTFSGGMKRRLEIARALLHTPRVLFLDEPTLGLDPQTRNHIWGYIQTLAREKGMTVFFTTHYMDEADRVADEIAIIDHGKILTRGTPSNIKQETKTASLEEAFIKLTGSSIRSEEASSVDQLRSFGKAWGGGRRT